ncbi:MAG TPA: hypothetical protein VMQ81_05360 [Acidimicrobiia bacterium]|nr:hypothetical protein [Acidimicrobiia bacterium]
MAWVVRALMVTAGVLVFVVLAAPVGATPPAAATPRLPCLSGLCPPDLPVDPTVPSVPETPDVDVPPRPAEVPGLPEALGAPAPDPAAPSPAPTEPAAGKPAADPADPGRPAANGGGGGPRPASVGTPASSSRPAAVASAARSFSLLFVLAALVAGYLLVQGRLDARDPKLVAAPIDDDDEVIRFR